MFAKDSNSLRHLINQKKTKGYPSIVRFIIDSVQASQTNVLENYESCHKICPKYLNVDYLSQVYQSLGILSQTNRMIFLKES